MRGPGTRCTAPWAAQGGASFGVKRPNGAGRVPEEESCAASWLTAMGLLGGPDQPELKLQQTRPAMAWTGMGPNQEGAV